jgi:hypothetical protein
MRLPERGVLVQDVSGYPTYQELATRSWLPERIFQAPLHFVSLQIQSGNNDLIPQLMDNVSRPNGPRLVDTR